MLGKITRLGLEFESKCKGIVRVMRLVTAFEANPEQSLDEVIAGIPRDMQLARTINAFPGLTPGVTATEIETLNTAREARNALIHEGGEFPLHGRMGANHSRLTASLEQLRTHVRQLAAGDNLVSSWAYSIDEKEAPPRALMDGYERAVEEWIFESVWDLLEHEGGVIPPCRSADGRVYEDYSSLPDELRPKWAR